MRFFTIKHNKFRFLISKWNIVVIGPECGQGFYTFSPCSQKMHNDSGMTRSGFEPQGYFLDCLVGVWHYRIRNATHLYNSVRTIIKAPEPIFFFFFFFLAFKAIFIMFYNVC